MEASEGLQSSLFSSALVEGSNGSPSVCISTTDGAHFCQIYLLGATVTSWKSYGQERLFLSSIAVFDGAKALRGGIPLVFPQFGRPDTNMAQHGFARNAMWIFNGSIVTDSSITARFSLEDTDVTRAMWPHRFKLHYDVTLTAGSLSSAFAIENNDSSPFECQALLHTYIRVPDISTTQVRGFCGSTYSDKLHDGVQVREESEYIPFSHEVDRVYSFEGDADEPIFVHEVFEHCVEGVIQPVNDVMIRADRWATLNETRVPIACVLWNPWIDKAAATADMDDDAYKHFVCIEPGTVSDTTVVVPGGTMVVGQKLTAEVSKGRVLRQET